MATRMRVVCSVFCLIVWAFAVSADSCVDITFPTTDVTLGANSSLTEVRFEVVNRCREPLEDYRLSITAFEGKNPKMAGSVNELCVIRSGVSTEDCSCENKEKGLSCYARDTFPRQPIRTWEIDFRSVFRSHRLEHVYFNVLYPTILKKFYISNYEGSATLTMNEGHTAQFKCHGDWGNPPSTILLRGPQDNILASKIFGPSSASYLAFAKKRLSCSDSGQYRCEVNGTDQYRAVTLHIRCPMEFKEHDSSRDVTVQIGGDVRISFEATSYTMDISPCMLMTPAGKGIPCNSKRSDVTVTGSLPDVVITLKLTDITEQDLGVWALSASNPSGSDTLKFHLSVTEHNVVDRARSEGPGLSSLWTAVGATIALLAFTVIVLIIFIWVRRKLSRAAGSPDASGPKSQPPGSDEDYLEPVPHRVERSDLDSDDKDPQSRKPQVSDGDYLEPEPRHVEQKEPCSSTEPDHTYSEVNPATMIDTARVPAPGASRQRELYQSLCMAEVGERSVYSSIGKHGNQAPLARVTAPSNKCLIQ